MPVLFPVGTYDSQLNKPRAASNTRALFFTLHYPVFHEPYLKRSAEEQCDREPTECRYFIINHFTPGVYVTAGLVARGNRNRAYLSK